MIRMASLRLVWYLMAIGYGTEPAKFQFRISIRIIVAKVIRFMVSSQMGVDGALYASHTPQQVLGSLYNRRTVDGRFPRCR